MDPPPVVISLTLFEGETLQVATVTLAARADSALPAANVPVPAGDVALQLTDGVTTWPLSATSTPGRMAAAMSPLPGTTYTLSGTVLGLPVSSTTTMPAAVSLISPPGDTLTRATTPTHPCNFGSGRVCFPVSFTAGEPLAVRCFVPDSDFPQQPLSGGCLNDDGTTILVIQPAPRIQHAVLVFYNGDVGTPRGRAPLLEFGAALTVRKAVDIQ